MGLNLSALNAEQRQIFNAAVAGIPRVAEMIVASPAELRARAFDAAQHSYQKTARDFGHGGTVAEEWVSELMHQLSILLRLERRLQEPLDRGSQRANQTRMDESPQHRGSCTKRSPIS